LPDELLASEIAQARSMRKTNSPPAATAASEFRPSADPRAALEAIDPAQRLRSTPPGPDRHPPRGSDRAAEALAVERSSAVRRELNGIDAELREERIAPSEAAAEIVTLVERVGLQPVSLDDVPPPITEEDLGVVGWMAVPPLFAGS
jgi:hypothetical protein